MKVTIEMTAREIRHICPPYPYEHSDSSCCAVTEGIMAKIKKRLEESR